MGLWLCSRIFIRLSLKNAQQACNIEINLPIRRTPSTIDAINRTN